MWQGQSGPGSGLRSALRSGLRSALGLGARAVSQPYTRGLSPSPVGPGAAGGLQDALREAKECAAGMERLQRGQQLLMLDKGSWSLSVQAEAEAGGAGAITASTASLDLTALAAQQPDVLAVAQYLFFLLAREGQLGPKSHQQVGLRPPLTEPWRRSEAETPVFAFCAEVRRCGQAAAWPWGRRGSCQRAERALSARRPRRKPRARCTGAGRRQQCSRHGVEARDFIYPSS